MQRVHLIELEDCGWLPGPIRDGGTDLLDFAFERIGFYNGVADRLVALRRLERAEAWGMTYREYTLEIMERGRHL